MMPPARVPEKTASITSYPSKEWQGKKNTMLRSHHMNDRRTEAKMSQLDLTALKRDLFACGFSKLGPEQTTHSLNSVAVS